MFEIKDNKPSFRKSLAKLQSRRGLPVIVGAVLVFLIMILVFSGSKKESVLSRDAPGVVEEDQKVTMKKKVVTKSKKKTVKRKKPETAAPFEPTEAPEDEETTMAPETTAEEETTSVETTEAEAEAETTAAETKGGYTLLKGFKADKEKQDAVRAELKFSWDMYKQHAWGHDILAPLTKRGKRWVGSGIQIIDALDTLYITGLKKEYEDGIEWIEKELDMRTYRADLPLFESCIRILGGLLGAHALDPRPILLKRAKEIGDMLWYAVATSPSAFAHPTSNWKQKRGSGPQIVLAELGTLQMEYTYLSALTGDMKYADGTLRAFENLYKTGRGIFGEQCNVGGGTCGGKLHVGGGTDSTYEYFAKMYELSGRKVPQFLTMWQRTVRDLKPLLMKSTPKQYVYFGDTYGGGRNVVPNFGHLHCFIGGTYTMMAQYAKSEASKKEEFEIGAGVGRTCHGIYEASTTKLGASGVSLAGKDITITGRDYVLRPEAIETWFYLYRYTKDEKYRKWAWDAFLALKKHCRVPGGYAGLNDVNNPKSHLDTMETFLLAETFKYLYCIFGTDTDCDLSKYVFNTEAHFIPILDPTKDSKYQNLYRVMEKL